MQHGGQQALRDAKNVDLWILEVLLDRDDVEDPLVKTFYDGIGCEINSLPVDVQVRLFLRVVRDQRLTVSQPLLDALHCITNLAVEPGNQFAVCSTPAQLVAPEDLLLQVSC